MTVDLTTFETVCQRMRQAALYTSSADALEWDERTGMPAAAGEYRADQVAELRSAAHALKTGAAYGEALATLKDQLDDEDPHGDISTTIRELHRDWCRDSRLPVDLVARLSVATVRGQQAWDAARKNDRFGDFRGALEQIITLKRDVGQRLAEGTSSSAYEALMDEYEPGASVAALTPVFADLKQRLTDLITRITDAPRQPRVELLSREYPIDAQRRFSAQIAHAVGFDFDRGRLDETSHPFCTTLGPQDCRILTRYEANWFPGGFFGTLHEAGHGMYEQGLRDDWFGLPPGSYVSLGIHESQSRLWENQVGRSLPFWKWLYPSAKSAFPDALDEVSLDELYFAVNHVRPSMIRVEADEATYNLHILIRFELEQALISGDLSVDELPMAWNEQYQRCLGIQPSNDAEGVLQDVHWSAGLFGYFPTYTLGNLAAAQLYAAAVTDMPDLEHDFSRGEFERLLHWLCERVHRHGRCYSGAELIKNATGDELSADHLMDYLESKLTPLFGL
ncbi:carboxypeptidase M32 [Roseiconus nitratireducens]|uniref:Metal-dependent carboxypeptidase n=1 Tax=Roseiconus nitratireducens TaxID=2605748 RepID=A0A5M6DFH6_9BACT|nr:carboxypeptidase M32 [Roseiconus nitratireducens]KAA5546153.1 carboxypeptidase M32 [Roseiconus nitratireducens]